MATYSISRSLSWKGRITEKMAQVCRMFGLTAERLRKKHITFNGQVEINDGDIVYITGPSGAGKTILLQELEKAIPPEERVNLEQIELSADKGLIDCLDCDFLTAMRFFSIAGLNDVFCVLNQPINLSEGQKYRFRLAMALATKKKFIFADEFCSNLDRITAAVIAYNIRKFAKRHATTFILAASHRDILLDLQPDVVVERYFTETQVIYKYARF